jgi:hypothetical protein
MGGRNAQRYLNLAQAPIEVQHAYSENKISLTIASRVCQLRRDRLASLAQEIRDGGDPAIVVKWYLDRPSPPLTAEDLSQLMAGAAKSIESSLNGLRQVETPAGRIQTPSSQGVRDLVHMLEREHSGLLALGETLNALFATAMKLELATAERRCDDAG